MSHTAGAWSLMGGGHRQHAVKFSKLPGKQKRLAGNKEITLGERRWTVSLWDQITAFARHFKAGVFFFFFFLLKSLFLRLPIRIRCIGGAIENPVFGVKVLID